MTDELRKQVFDLCDYERDCLLDFSGLARRDVRWGAAMSAALEHLIGLGWLTRSPMHSITESGMLAARVALEHTEPSYD